MTLRQRLRSEDDGAVYVLMVLAIFILFAMAAFAVDVGWIFLNKSRAQRAADSAALAGVTALPAEPTIAIARAHEFAAVNGYDDTDPNTVVTPTPTADNELLLQIAKISELRKLDLSNADIDDAQVRSCASIRAILLNRSLCCRTDRTA